MKRIRRLIAPLVVLALAACAPAATEPTAPVDTREADRAAILAAVESWAAASQAKDPEAFASVYAADAVLMLEGAPDVSGQQGIREAITGMMQDPNFNLSFEPTKVEVARSGDLAYEAGTYSLSVSDPEGNAATQQGHYIVVWRKAADGNWKVIFDVPVSDPAEAATAE